jgi:hypothetical protein
MINLIIQTDENPKDIDMDVIEDALNERGLDVWSIKIYQVDNCCEVDS